jgi:hypothetical protein
MATFLYIAIIYGIILTLISPTRATYCTYGGNVNINGTRSGNAIYYNPSCTAASVPYCPSSKNACTACDPDKFNDFWAMCDCPPNQFCDPIVTSSTYATCIGLGGASCSSVTDCAIYGYSPVGQGPLVGYLSCVNGQCLPCNQTFYGTTTYTCPGGSPYPLSSRAGETRQCSSNGQWIGGGATASPATTTSTTAAAAVATTVAATSATTASQQQQTSSSSLPGSTTTSPSRSDSSQTEVLHILAIVIVSYLAVMCEMLL